MRLFISILFVVCALLPAPQAHPEEDGLSQMTADMVLIPAGTFNRGCDRFGERHGAPAHRVYLDAFMIDKFEVTNLRYEQVVPEHEIRRSQFSQCDYCPATKVSWYEAADYCHLVGKSLPSEAQWEKAASNGDGCQFPWGPEFDSSKNQARGGVKLRENARPVGSYPPNDKGLYDVAGNAWEWVSDWFSIRYYFREIMYNPRGPRNGIMKVRRGGAWSDSVIAMKTGYRDWSYPFSRGFNDIGFRCAINLKKKSSE